MREKDIRPDSLICENDKLFAEDIQKILNRRSEFIEIPCPACESDKYRVVFEKGSFTFVSCTRCESVFINPRPTPEMLAEFYATSQSIKHWNDRIFPVSENVRRSEIFAPRAQRIAELCSKHKTETKVLIDVGAGFGTFCEEVKKLAIFDEVIAVEPSHELAETCRCKGLDLIEKPIEEVDLDGVSVITNFELIEHLYWPKDFLQACAGALDKGGLFVLTTPNIKGFDLLVLGKLSDNIRGPDHLNYFHPKSLCHLLQSCGFEVVEVITPGKLDAGLVRKKILNGQLDISNRPFLKLLLIDDWETKGEVFQRFLQDNQLSSHLWMVARKK
ncbi:MAG: class I SAM-dependent methyltransferase [Phycisphaerae bacterium]|jgi:2-polyprenyl-3-methyl-5-hydroxy-6-metoxy-1,4-benzoquinol methylase/ribosomal protein S27E